jgi:putative redox protein
MPSERLTFPNRHGAPLSGVLDRPLGTEAQAVAVFAHCFTCSKDLTAVRQIAKALTDAGIAVLRFDFTGLGQSGGEFAESTFTANVADIGAAVQYLTARDLPPTLLIGHSLGGTAVLAAAMDLPQIKAVATIGAPADPLHVTHLFRDDLAQIEAQGEAHVDIGGRPFTISRHFVADVDQADILGRLPRLGKSLLILHSPVDTVVGIDNAARLYDAARHPKSFISLDHADHLLSNPADSRYVGVVIAAWASRYLTTARPAAADDDAAVITAIGREAYATAVTLGRHHLTADEPVAKGGQDAGPAPYQLLAAALGACTGMTLRMYADRKGWPLEAVEVTVHHDTLPPAAEGERRGDRFTRQIAIRGDLDEEQRSRLLAIADKCPVHRTLSHGSQIDSQGVRL